MEENYNITKIERRMKYIIDNLLLKQELTDKELDTINTYMKDYYNFLDCYQSAETHSYNDVAYMQAIVKPMSEAYKYFYMDEANNLPVIKMFKEAEKNKLLELEKGFARTLTPPQQTTNNNLGFVEVISIVLTAVMFGIIAGTLLFFIK